MGTSTCICGLTLVFLAANCAHLAQADTFGSGADTFDIEFATIGNPGNPADATGDPNPVGSVPYTYRIGKREISERLIDKANTLGGLGITKDTRSPNKPATSVTWFEVATFVNWLNTSTGNNPAYKFDASGNFQLWTPSDAGYDPNNRYRNSIAKYFLPSNDEWYKAAYYDPSAGVYYNYPAGSDTPPIAVASGTDPGTAVIAYASNEPADIMLAGGLSPYGTMAQGGNVSEWGETAADLLNNVASVERTSRGGSFVGSFYLTDAAWRDWFDPTTQTVYRGFRVASTAVPEPSTLLLPALAVVPFSWRRKRGIESHTPPRTASLRFALLMIAILFALASTDSAYAQSAFFMGLGDLPGGDFVSYPHDISGDGSIVVGISKSGLGNLYEPYRWTRATGIVGLGTLDSYGGDTFRISNDGSTIVVGFGSNGIYRWRESTGKVVVDVPPGQFGGVFGVNSDGSKIASIRDVWTEAGGWVGSPNGMRIADMSADGLTFTGWAGAGEPSHIDAFIWSQQDGYTQLGPPPPNGGHLSDPTRISANGNVVLGNGLRWEKGIGLSEAPRSPDGSSGCSSGLSSDGSVMVGGGCFWRKPRGSESLLDVLANEYGLASQFAEWSNIQGWNVSDDGRTITGIGKNPVGNTEAWIAFLGTPVPEPSTLLLAALALVPLTWRRRALRIHGDKCAANGAVS